MLLDIAAGATVQGPSRDSNLDDEGRMGLAEEVRCALVAAGVSERGFMVGGFVIEEVDEATVAVTWHVPPGGDAPASVLADLSRCSRTLHRAGLHARLTGRDDTLRVLCRR